MRIVLNSDKTLLDYDVLDESKYIGYQIITADPPQGFYQAVWDGTKWTEGLSSEAIQKLLDTSKVVPSEIDELKQQVSDLQQVAEDAQQQALVASQALAEYITDNAMKGDEI